MSIPYKTPGIYIEEIPAFPPSIVATPTAIPAFIGCTNKAIKLTANDLAFIPTKINSLPEYEQYFGGLSSEDISVLLEDELLKIGSAISLVSRKISLRFSRLKNYMHYQLQLYFANGGGPCYAVSVGMPAAGFIKSNYIRGLQSLKEVKATLLVVADGASTANENDLYELYNAALLQAWEAKDRFVILDICGDNPDRNKAIEFFRNQITGGNNAAALQYGAAYHPMLKTTVPIFYTDRTVTILHRTLTKEMGRADITAPGAFNKLSLDNPLFQGVQGMPVYSQVKSEIAKVPLVLPPSAAIAGAYVATDLTRGVWKAPANISLSAVKEPLVNITDTEQADLNITISGKSVNAIRLFTGKGSLIWGARTLAGNDNEWRYIPVRRFVTMIEVSVKKSVDAFVFEPNDGNTWVRVRGMIQNFLIVQWKSGALMGSKPEESFFVNIGLGQTMTAQDITDGKMIIEIGLAVVRPAEFIIIRIMVMMQAA